LLLFALGPTARISHESAAHLHSSPDERQVDAHRRNELQDAGRQDFEYPYADVARRPDQSLRR
jgi:hypothetical protein